MNTRRDFIIEHALLLLRWLLTSALLSVTVGSASALFLWLLDLATKTQQSSPYWLWSLPFWGAISAWLYLSSGREAGQGNNLVIAEIQHPMKGLPWFMAPLIVLATILTHLGGGSAGREGTAVQMGAGLAGIWARWTKPWLGEDYREILLMGVAAGFGGVFGTPVAGAIFAAEVLSVGRLPTSAILPCLLASCGADFVCTTVGGTHLHYPVDWAELNSSGWLHRLGIVGLIILLGAVAGLVAKGFSEGLHLAGHWYARFLPDPIRRITIGSLVVVFVAEFVVGRDYLGLGTTNLNPHAVTIGSCFRAGGAHDWSWLCKLLLTILTLACGLKGGEVTPLFFIGAALGNVLAVKTGLLPVDVAAALGFVAVFSAATNAPLASSVLAIELFGPDRIEYVFAACFSAWLVAGGSSIYSTQHPGWGKMLKENAGNHPLDTKTST
ncbi:chloride channel protein [Planctopirus hydrillae]|uniref:Voltage-gated chloride channel protein n=1 Tax=Planctopirus hydrillae TaxID=1841610 RepID=A0A1C3ESX0_9PLAN|nr:chloride channel protein [Planctopirus hydrillae]ODA36352.1 hypothetical protein A6X21_16220 [Planctopirus hydrillae]